LAAAPDEDDRITRYIGSPDETDLEGQQYAATADKLIDAKTFWPTCLTTKYIIEDRRTPFYRLHGTRTPPFDLLAMERGTPARIFVKLPLA